MIALAESIYIPSVTDIERAYLRLRHVVTHTPLTISVNLSQQMAANIWLKREDLQVVRSYKLRGAYNKISTLDKESLAKGVVCASAGNHAQGVAYSCQKMGIQGKIFMPTPTPKQKVRQVKLFGKAFVEVILTGDTFDDAYNAAMAYSEVEQVPFIHPFDDEKVIEGQGTVGLEILKDSADRIDYLFVPVGGGGLLAGILAVFKNLSEDTKIIGVEAAGAPAMKVSLEKGENVTLAHIDKFVDGAAVKHVGDKAFDLCRHLLDDMIVVDEGAVCTTILKLYDEEGMVVEPAGALSVTALGHPAYRDQINGKNVVCVISGSNNDITRTEEIRERSLLYEKLKHYFIIRFPQRSGALRKFVSNVLGPNDDITHFQYQKKTDREQGPAIVGLELQRAEDFAPLVARMEAQGFVYEYLNEKPDLFQFLI
ncbi:MAG: threonine ammonia-lyase IlvA [Bacteroidetes Order II. Incertae sedis bacterium]|nr:threonine ammonia-lyase IlvA [Bacteroidetes Order II. bacterium]